MTSTPTQQDHAEVFRSLHQQDQPLVLVNVWDVGSALTVLAAGAPALATSSWSVAAARGVADGEETPLGQVVELVETLVDRASVPVTVDLESGYGRTADDVGRSVRRVIEAGAVGCNLEDGYPDGSGSGLRDLGSQAARLQAARAAADDLAVRAFINARTDVFFQPGGDRSGAGQDRLDEVLLRAKAYEQAGADGLFVPGLRDVQLIAELVELSPLPVNVMVDSEAHIVDLVRAGVARISFGPSPYLAAMAALARQASAVTQVLAGSSRAR